MSHGNVQVTTGRCRVCRRVAVPLTIDGTCVDAFACFEAWCARGAS